jgi:ActR/RegA family two-component response regulator
MPSLGLAQNHPRRNVSETARRLNRHRRTLQRILAKRAPR